MASVNRVILIGNCGKDPETRYMASGDAVTNVSIATTESWKNKEGEKQESCEWHNLVFFRRLAEVAGQFLRKGSPVYVEGKIKTRSWNDKDGNKRYTTEIHVDNLQLLGGKRDDDAAPSEPRSPREPKQARAPQDYDDDIPF